MDTPETADALAARLAAMASTQRLRIVATLVEGPLHVSALARRVEMSRALLYMHLRKLEEAGFVTSRLELGEDGKAMNVFSAEPFTVTITPAVVAAAIAATDESEE
ncbi:winged helix-turn-helix domain-containing protein [uncultured Demequina sp.]|uniref:ArsR/SmtB family transcription factor n=1 Tax=uncultured Demequina sp. TaxID=693499 RepID=UPI0025CEA644|nr:winged helix-turn-helix domain-containing protein [uncultured Demequina sp.]